LRSESPNLLQQTPMTSGEFSDGWLMVGARHPYLGLVLLSPTLVGMAAAAGLSPLYELELFTILAVLPAFGAALGLWASTTTSRISAQQRMSNALGGSALVCLFSLALGLGCIPLVLAVVAFECRRRTCVNLSRLALARG
jgi:hypothetical protein